MPNKRDIPDPKDPDKGRNQGPYYGKTRNERQRDQKQPDNRDKRDGGKGGNQRDKG